MENEDRLRALSQNAGIGVFKLKRGVSTRGRSIVRRCLRHACDAGKALGVAHMGVVLPEAGLILKQMRRGRGPSACALIFGNVRSKAV